MAMLGQNNPISNRINKPTKIYIYIYIILYFKNPMALKKWFMYFSKQNQG